MTRLLDDRLSGPELMVLFVIGFTVLAPFSCWRIDHDQREPLRIWMFGQPEHLKAMQRVVQQYQEQNAQIRLVLDHITADYLTKLLPALQAGAVGDVLYLHWSMITEVAAKGALASMEDLVAQDQYDMTDFFPGSTAPYTFEGHLYAIPFRGSTMLLFYNKDLFDEAGVAYPSDDWRWDDFLEAAKKLTIVEQGAVKQVGCVPEEPTAWIYSGGGRYASDDLKQLYFTDPNTLRALQFYMDLRNKHKVTPQTMSSMGTDPLEVDVFENGRVAMYISGPWELDRYAHIKRFRWNVALFPKGPAGRQTRYAGTGFGIWSGSRHQDEAWKLVKYLCGPEAGKSLSRIPTDIPARRSIAYSEAFLRPDLPWDMEAFLRAMEPKNATVRVFPRSPHWNWVRERFGEHFDEVLFNDQDLAETMRRLEQRVQTHLEQRWSASGASDG